MSSHAAKATIERPAWKASLGRAQAFFRMQWQVQRSYPLRFLTEIVSAGGTFAATYFLSQIVKPDDVAGLETYQGNYLGFAIVGYVLSTFLGVAITKMGQWIRQAQFTGILEPIVVSNIKLWEVTFYCSLHPLLMSFLRILFYLFIASLITGLRLDPAAFGVLLLVMVATVISFAAFGLLNAATVIAFRRNNPAVSVLISASLLLSGVFYPVEILPEWLQFLSNLLPLTYALEASRSLLLGSGPFAAVLPPMMGMVLFGAITIPITLGLFRYAVKRARRDGVLGYY